MDIPEERGLKLTPHGTLALTETADGPNADLRGEMLWDLALRRRALAADVAGLMSFECSLRWHETLKVELLRTPPRAPAESP